VPPVALALINAVFELALHHDSRAQRQPLPHHKRAHVQARVRGPLTGEPAPGGLEVEITIDLVPRAGPPKDPSRVSFVIDLAEQRLLAPAVALAELPLSRGGMARLIGELESWCYRGLPVLSKSGPLPAAQAVARTDSEKTFVGNGK